MTRDERLIELATEKGRLLARIEVIDEQIAELKATKQEFPGIYQKVTLRKRILLALHQTGARDAHSLAESMSSTTTVVRITLNRLLKKGHVRKDEDGLWRLSATEAPPVETVPSPQP